MEVALYFNGVDKMLLAATVASTFLGRLVSENIYPNEFRPYIFRGPREGDLPESLEYALYALYCTISVFTQLFILNFYPLLRRIFQPLEVANLFLYAGIVYALLIRFDAFNGTKFLTDCQLTFVHIILYFLDWYLLIEMIDLPLILSHRVIGSVVVFLLKTFLINAFSIWICC